MRTHGQHGVQEEDALLRPRHEVAVVGDVAAQIAFALGEDVGERKMLASEGGVLLPGRTENARPCAWPSSW